MKLVFATNNPFKFREIKELLKSNLKLLTLKDINVSEEIPETHDTIEENAVEKAQYIYNKYHIDCFADDTGLEIEALNGEPGVYSARYAGKNCTFDDNINKVLENLKDSTNRRARFRTVIALVIKGKINLFEGVVNGSILTYRKGTNGFGYDPIFVPENFEKTFAEMALDEKNKVSHRTLAIKKLISYLNNK
ncbi:MAG: non-canonical purine NTP diphosphatase [Bacteroidales bacterium]|nr:non-canonical purine NTP diphosphatase [Bacteroidales bacterium]